MQPQDAHIIGVCSYEEAVCLCLSFGLTRQLIRMVVLCKVCRVDAWTTAKVHTLFNLGKKTAATTDCVLVCFS